MDPDFYGSIPLQGNTDGLTEENLSLVRGDIKLTLIQSCSLQVFPSLSLKVSLSFSVSLSCCSIDYECPQGATALGPAWFYKKPSFSDPSSSSSSSYDSVILHLQYLLPFSVSDPDHI